MERTINLLSITQAKYQFIACLFFICFSGQAQTHVTLTAGGVLTINDTDSTNDVITLTDDSTNLSIHNQVGGFTYSGAGVSQLDPNTVLVPLSGITSSVTIDGSAGDDALNINVQSAFPAISFTTQNIDTIQQQGNLTTTTGAITLAASTRIIIDGDLITTSGAIALSTNDEIVINGRLETISGTIDVLGRQEVLTDPNDTHDPLIVIKGITVDSTGVIASETGDIKLRAIGGGYNNEEGCHVKGGSISSSGIGANAAKITIESYGYIGSRALVIEGGNFSSVDGDILLEGSNFGYNISELYEVLDLDSAIIIATGAASISIKSRGGHVVRGPAVYIHNQSHVQCHDGDLLISGNWDARLDVDPSKLLDDHLGTWRNTMQGVLIVGDETEPFNEYTKISSTGLGEVTITGKNPAVEHSINSAPDNNHPVIAGVTIGEFSLIHSDMSNINIEGTNSLPNYFTGVGVFIVGSEIASNTGDINLIGHSNYDLLYPALSFKYFLKSWSVARAYIKSIEGDINLTATNDNGPSAVGDLNNNSVRFKTGTGKVKLDCNDFRLSGPIIIPYENQLNHISLVVDYIHYNSQANWNFCSIIDGYWYGEDSSHYNPNSQHYYFSDLIDCFKAKGTYTITPKTQDFPISIGADVSGSLSIYSGIFVDSALSITIGGVTAGDISVTDGIFTDSLYLIGNDITINNLDASENYVSITSKPGHFIAAANHASPGIIASEVIIKGNVSPGGLDAVSNLKINGNVTFSAEDMLSVDILSSGNDTLIVQDTASILNLGNAKLRGNVKGITPAIGDTFLIVDVAGTLLGTFNGLAEGATVTFDGSPFSISYTGGDGNDIVLTALDPCPGLTAILYVDAAAETDTEDGSSWANAISHLQPALDLAASCSQVTEIRVASGTYLPTASPEGSATTVVHRNNAFHFDTDVLIKGSYNPTTGNQDHMNPSILSGDFLGDDVVTGGDTTLNIAGNSENAYRVLITAGLSAAALIDGFTIQGGHANDMTNFTYSGLDFIAKYGGGIFNYESSPTFSNMTFYGNSAASGAGAILNYFSSPSFTFLTVSHNLVTDVAGDCGGMFNVFSTATITNAIFSNNSSDDWGGGMRNNSSIPVITNAIFSNNAAGSGGGMYNSSSSPIITNSRFTDNIATGYSTTSDEHGGGGLYNRGDSTTIINTTFSGNAAIKNGGGMMNYGSYCCPTLTNVIFYNNKANNDGGGIYVEGQSSSPSSPTITNATFSNNTADNEGGGMYVSWSNPTLNNCVLYGNGVDIEFGWANNGNITANNCFSENFVHADFDTLTADPFVNSADPDGLDNMIETEDDGLVPAAGSPLVHAGDSSFNTLPTDINGYARIEGGNIDVGAYEYHDCIQKLFLGIEHSPLSGAYTAGQQIITMTAVDILLGNTVQLNAPEVELNALMNVANGAELEIDQDGCN